MNSLLGQSDSDYVPQCPYCGLHKFVVPASDENGNYLYCTFCKGEFDYHTPQTPRYTHYYEYDGTLDDEQWDKDERGSLGMF